MTWLVCCHTIMRSILKGSYTVPYTALPPWHHRDLGSHLARNVRKLTGISFALIIRHPLLYNVEIAVDDEVVAREAVPRSTIGSRSLVRRSLEESIDDRRT